MHFSLALLWASLLFILVKAQIHVVDMAVYSDLECSVLIGTEDCTGTECEWIDAELYSIEIQYVEGDCQLYIQNDNGDFLNTYNLRQGQCISFASGIAINIYETDCADA